MILFICVMIITIICIYWILKDYENRGWCGFGLWRMCCLKGKYAFLCLCVYVGVIWIGYLRY